MVTGGGRDRTPAKHFAPPSMLKAEDITRVPPLHSAERAAVRYMFTDVGRHVMVGAASAAESGKAQAITGNNHVWPGANVLDRDKTMALTPACGQRGR